MCKISISKGNYAQCKMYISEGRILQRIMSSGADIGKIMLVRMGDDGFHFESRKGSFVRKGIVEWQNDWTYNKAIAQQLARYSWTVLDEMYIDASTVVEDEQPEEKTVVEDKPETTPTDNPIELPPLETFTGWELIDRLRSGTVFLGGDGMIRLKSPDDTVFEIRKRNGPWMRTELRIDSMFMMTLAPCKYPYTWDEALEIVTMDKNKSMDSELDPTIQAWVDDGDLVLSCDRFPVEALRRNWRVY